MSLAKLHTVPHVSLTAYFSVHVQLAVRSCDSCLRDRTELDKKYFLAQRDGE